MKLVRRFRVQRTALPSEAVVGRMLSTGRWEKGVVLGSLLVELLARARLLVLLLLIVEGVVLACAGSGGCGRVCSGVRAGVGV